MNGTLVQMEDEATKRDPERQARRWIMPLVIGLLAMASLWPAIINGGPFFMADTPSYARSAASGFVKTFGIKTDWTNEYFRVYANAGEQAQARPETSGEAPRHSQLPVTLSGRSIYYGALLYLSYIAGSLWIVIVLQCLLAAGTIALSIGTVSKAAGTRIKPSGLLLIGLVIALTSPMAFFTSYLMPDIFGGFALLATASILFLWHHLSSWEKRFWLVLLAYSLAAHSANLLIIGALMVLAISFALWRRIPLSKSQLAGLAACIAAAVLAEGCFSYVVKSITGASPVRPPFVAMRLISDGPGYDYLREHCGTEAYIYCRVVGRPNTHHDTLLWSSDPQISLFRGLSSDEQRASAAQQSRFILAVLSDRPMEVLERALTNSLRQAVSFDLEPFNYSSGNRVRFQETIPSQTMAQIRPTRAYRNIMPTRSTEILSALTAILSILFLCFFLASARSDEGIDRLRAYGTCVLAGIALNAAICGALSGPKGRYEMRVIWILPLIAGAIASTGSMNWRRRSIESQKAFPEAA